MARLRARRFSARIALLLIVAFTLAIVPPPSVAVAAPADYYFWYAYAADKVYPTTAPTSGARLATARRITGLSFSAARSEFEGRQIAIRPTSQALRDIWLEPSDLTYRDAEGVTHTLDSSNASTYKVHYVNITAPSTGFTRKGLEPDPLLPMTLANGERLGWRPGTTPDLTRRGANANTTQPFYVLYKVPEETAPGSYKGTIRVTATGADGTPAPTLTIPVTITVYPFSVAQRSLKTSFAMNLQWAAYTNSAAHGWLGMNANPGPGATRVAERTTYKGDQMGGWLKYMSDHRVSPQAMLPAWESGSDWAPPVDNGDMVARHAELTDYLGTGAATTYSGTRLAFDTIKLPEYGAPSYVADPFASASNTAKAAQYYRTMAAEIGSANIGKAYAYPIDEPSASKRTFVENYAAFVHTNAPGVKFFVTVDPTPMNFTLLKNVDIYGQRLPFFYRDYDAWVKKILGAGKQVWIYTHATYYQAVTPSYLIDQPLTSTRAQGWFVYDSGATGLLYFNINAWRPQVGSASFRDPYVDPLSYRTGSGSTQLYANGDGSLVYQGYYPALGLYVEGSPPVGSLRMEGIRDGLEDYEYIKLVQSKLGKSKADSYVAGIIGDLAPRKAGVLYFPPWQKSASTYDKLRNQMGSAISTAMTTSAVPYDGPPRAIVPRRPRLR